MSDLVSTMRPERNPSGLAAAFLVALLLHGAGLVAIAYLRLSPPSPPGQNEITIDLAPQLAEVETVAPTETLDAAPEMAEAPVEKPPEAEPVKPPEEVVAQTEPPPDAVPVEPESPLITSQAPQAEPLAPPPPVMAQVPEPPKPEKVEPPKPDPAKVAAAREARLKAIREERRREQIEEQREKLLKERREAKAKAAREARARADADRRGTSTRDASSSSRQGSTGQAARGNDPNALAMWRGMIASAIHGRMNRNAAAGTAGGVATVRFTVSRSGQVLSAGLAGSSGVGAIDSAALAAVRGGLPAAPAGYTSPTLSVTVPMRFRPGG